MTKRITVGISGVEGSFSEEAGKHYAKTLKHKPKYIYLVTVERVLGALEDGTIDIGIFPIENSTGGIVLEAVHAMAKHRFVIEKIFHIEIHQNLLALPKTTPARIAQIISHDQALKQCRMYLKREWPDTELVEYEDTAKAAADLASGRLPKTSGVIASREAAKRYKLAILEPSIQDLKYNFTTFIAGRRIGT
jgi:prephenate dehydratase